jgi:hypothetical protein
MSAHVPFRPATIIATMFLALAACAKSPTGLATGDPPLEPTVPPVACSPTFAVTHDAAADDTAAGLKKLVICEKARYRR